MATFYGTDINDFQITGYAYLYGGNGDDCLQADQDGFQIIEGGAGRDFLQLKSSSGAIYGGEFNDTIYGFTGNDFLYGGEGADFIRGNWSTQSGDDLMDGGGGPDYLDGAEGDDTLYGGSGNDGGVTITIPNLGFYNTGDTFQTITGLFGWGGRDKLYGQDGDDYLNGGEGRDALFGGEGADTFDFDAIADSKPNDRDSIRDFSRPEDDIIDLATIDANTKKSGDQAFRFIGGNGFHDRPGELRFKDGTLAADVNGDGRADMAIKVFGPHSLEKGDFAL